MKVAIAGNYALDPSTIAMHLLRSMSEFPIDAQILLRAPLEGHAGPVEMLADELAKALSIEVIWHKPTAGGGRESTILRDFDMVAAADAVLVYFHPDHVMSEDRGTTRLARYAMNTDKPLNAYAPTADGVDYVGSVDVEEPASA